MIVIYEKSTVSAVIRPTGIPCGPWRIPIGIFAFWAFAALPLALAAGETKAGPMARDISTLQARKAPEWLTRGVIYQIMPRNFTREGTLKAAARRLPQVAKLGANIAYLCPIMLQDDDMRREFWSPRQQTYGTNNPRNPYRIKDYDRIDPEYGTEADLREFVATAHKLGLRVMLDIVYTQTGPTCVLLEKHPDFYLRDAAGKVVLTNYHFSTLNFKNSGLRQYFKANMAHWIKDFDVDAFRCDSSDGVPLDFWEEARASLDPLRPDLVMLAEADSRLPDQVNAFDVNYSFRWYDATLSVVAKGEPASLLRQVWQNMRAVRPRGHRVMRYTDNHDLPRAVVAFGERGTAAMAAINFTLDGVPFLYNGQEIGDATPQNFYDPWAIRWESSSLPTVIARRAYYQKLCQMRRKERALTDGAVIWLDNDRPDSVVSFLRRADDEEILTVVNLSNRALAVRIKVPDKIGGSYRPLLSANAQATIDGKLTFKLEGFGLFVGKKTT